MIQQYKVIGNGSEHNKKKVKIISLGDNPETQLAAFLTSHHGQSSSKGGDKAMLRQETQHFMKKSLTSAFVGYEHAVKEGLIDDKWKAFMKFQIDRTRSIYEEAWPGIPLLHPSGQLSIAAAATFYKGILGKIEENNFDVFNTRACIGKLNKLKMLPGLWFKYSLLSQLKVQLNNKK